MSGGCANLAVKHLSTSPGGAERCEPGYVVTKKVITSEQKPNSGPLQYSTVRSFNTCTDTSILHHILLSISPNTHYCTNPYGIIRRRLASVLMEQDPRK